eukprot:273029-Hanusia_phi.AAC.4
MPVASLLSPYLTVLRLASLPSGICVSPSPPLVLPSCTCADPDSREGLASLPQGGVGSWCPGKGGAAGCDSSDGWPAAVSAARRGASVLRVALLGPDGPCEASSAVPRMLPV